MTSRPQGAVPPPKPKNLRFHRALFAYTAQEQDELSFSEGDLLVIVDDKSDKDWWKARCRGKEGLVPANFVAHNTDNEAEEMLSPLHDACRRGNMELVEECLLNRVPINSVDKAGNTPLHCAAHGGHPDVLHRLLALPHIKIDVKNRLGDTALHQAAWRGHAECIRLLREAGANLEGLNAEDKRAEDLAHDPETKGTDFDSIRLRELTELKRWRASLEPSGKGDYTQTDYQPSDQDDDSE